MSKEQEELKKLTGGLEYMITEEGEKLNVIRIRKRQIPLRLVLSDVKPLSEEVGNISEIRDLLQKDLFTGEYVERIIKLIRIMGNSGLRAMGDPPDLTDEWIGDRMRLGNINENLLLNLMMALYGGMQMETEAAEEEGKEIDVVLRDLRKKKEADN